MAVSATSPISSALPQMQLLQAQRAADRAEQNARSLRERAQEAQRSARQEQENARNVQVQADQAEGKAGSAKQGVAALKSLRQVQSGLDDIRQQIAPIIKKEPASSVSAAAAASASAASASAPATATPAVVNSQGQTTGTLVNTTA